MATSKPRITLIAAGGTISHRWDVRSGRSVPSLTAADLLEQTLVRFTVEARCVDYAQRTEDHNPSTPLLHFARGLQEEVARGTDGIVVTHGTDTMEEVSYLVDEAIASSVPIVFTGAMRPSWASGCDGIRNLENAVRVAQSVSAEYGTLVTMNDEIFEAWSVYKADTGALDAFAARRGAPSGRIFGADVMMAWRPVSRRRFLRLPQELPGMVPLVTPGVDDDAALLSRIEAFPLAGLVVASIAAGHLPPMVSRYVISLAQKGLPIVLCSSAVGGRTAEEYYYPRAYDDLRAAGVVVENWLSPRKARIRLMLSVGLKEPYLPFGQEFVCARRHN